MKKLLFISLLFFCIHSYSAVIDDASTTRANTNNVIRQALLTSLVAQEVHQAMQHESNIQQISVQNSHNVIQGVITCKAWYDQNADGDYNYHGCEISFSNYLSFQKYFNLYKPSYAHSITMVVLDTSDGYFDIYYN